MSLLTQARVSFGVALGHLLPEERLAADARWTGRALRIAWHLGDRQLLAFVLRMHGNELRKAGHPAAGLVRGLLATGRAAEAVDLARSDATGAGPPTPQWRVIEQITTAEAFARAGDEQPAAGMLSAALGDAETLRLPHQIQRVIRLTGHPGVLAAHAVNEHARAALTRLDRQLAGTAITSGTPRNEWHGTRTTVRSA